MKKNRAFSLIELSVVIFIVGLLIAGIAQTSKMITSSRLTAAQSQTKQSIVNNTPGLVLWYESTLASSFIKSEATDGAGVTTWYDNNPQALAKSKAYTTVVEPLSIYTENAIGGLPALRCEASRLQVVSPAEYRLDVTSLPVAINSFTVFIVAKSSSTHEIDVESTSGTSGTSGQTYVVGAAQGGAFMPSTTNSGMGISLGTNGVSVYEYADNYMPALAVYDGTTSKLLERPAIITVDYNNKVPTIFINSNTSRIGLRSPKDIVGAPFDFCWGANGAFTGYLGEVVIFKRHLLTSERKAVETYLSKKWKINFS